MGGVGGVWSLSEALNPFFAGGFEGLAALGGGTGPYSYLQFFWDFVTGKRRKSLGNGVFLAEKGDSVQGERKGRLGRSYVEVACGD